MKRLTERDEQGHWRIKYFTEILPAYWQACNRLAAIEDILGDEYELDEISKIVRCKDCCWHQNCEIEYHGQFGANSFCCAGQRTPTLPHPPRPLV